MCCLFGLLDFNGVLNTKEKNHMLNVLARECEARGTDATGIAYNFGGQLRVYKRPVPAHRLKIHLPHGVSHIMGHTRMTTQGSETRNYNNHPFLGYTDGKPFALAHNGVLWNDKELRFTLPLSDIETDSYAAVQLLEKYNALNLTSLKSMAETVEGSFVFTVLDSENNLFVVVGNNPFVLYRYKDFALYASTEEILRKAVKKLRLGLPQSRLEPKEGDILRIDRTGRITTGGFSPQQSYRHWWRCRPYYGVFDLDESPELHGDLFTVAKSMGVSADEVQALLDYGCAPSEIEELLYDPALLHEMAGELLYAY